MCLAVGWVCVSAPRSGWGWLTEEQRLFWVCSRLHEAWCPPSRVRGAFAVTPWLGLSAHDEKAMWLGGRPPSVPQTWPSRIIAQAETCVLPDT